MNAQGHRCGVLAPPAAAIGAVGGGAGEAPLAAVAPAQALAVAPAAGAPRIVVCEPGCELPSCPLWTERRTKGELRFCRV